MKIHGTQGGLRRGHLHLILIIIILLNVTDAQKSKKSKLPPAPALPPLPLPAPTPPLLPPVPSKEWVDRLTKAQLLFIRLHQERRKYDTTPYSPYACLPKYICIVEDTDGSKRTAVVNGLHPALRDAEVPNMNTPYIPSSPETTIGNYGRSDFPGPSVIDPADEAKYKDRLDHDDFLEEQEKYDQVAMVKAQELRKQRELLKQRLRADRRPSSSSEEDVSNEEDLEVSKEISSTTTTTTPSTPVVTMATGAPLNRTMPRFERNRFRIVIPIPKMFQKGVKIQKRQDTLDNKDSSSTSFFKRILHYRGKREATKPYLTKLGPGIKSSDQCRVLYNGCDLSYEQIMQIADEGNVLIEGDGGSPKKKSPQPKAPPRPLEDDELELALKTNEKIIKNKLFNKIKHFKKNKPLKSFVPLGGQNKNKDQNVQDQKTNDQEAQDQSDEDEKTSSEEERISNKKPQPPKKPTLPTKKPRPPQISPIAPSGVPSLPLVPLKFQWGKPQVLVNGRPYYINEEQLVGGKGRPTGQSETKVPTGPTTTTTPPPIFAPSPIYPKKPNRTLIETNVVKINATHALEIKTPKIKPWRPSSYLGKLLDKHGHPASFASVFTEIAGSAGGIHDYFDKIARTVGQPAIGTNRVQKQFNSVEVEQLGVKKKKTQKPEPEPEVDPPKEPKNKKNKKHQKKSDEDEDDLDDLDDLEGEEQSEEEVQDDDEEEEEPVVKEDDFIQIKPGKLPKYKVPDHKKPRKPKPPPRPHPGPDHTPKDDDGESASNEADEEQDDQEEALSDEQEDTSEERRNRIKEAMELDLPAHLPLKVQQAIREEIINGQKGKKKPEGPGPMEPLNYPGAPKPQQMQDKSPPGPHPHPHSSQPMQAPLGQHYYGPGLMSSGSSSSGGFLSSILRRPLGLGK